MTPPTLMWTIWKERKKSKGVQKIKNASGQNKGTSDVIVNILEHRQDSNKYIDDSSLIVEVGNF